MATVLMKKTGETDIYVEESNVAAHEILGWHRAKIEIAADGQSLVIPYGTYLDVQSGALKLNSVQVTASASEINNMDLNEELMIPVRYDITPDAASAVAVHAAKSLGASAQDVTSAITDPDVPRTVTVKGNVSGITGDVVITGDNIEDVEIEDTIALSGVTEVEGIKAFKTVTNIHLPARVHTPVYQVETATVAAAGILQVETGTVVGAVTGDGNASVTVTADGMTNSPKAVSVAVLNGDSASDVGGKARTALGLDADVSAFFTIGGSGADIVLTAKTKAANDATMNIAIDNDTCTGLTAAPTSANTTAGAAADTISTSGNATVTVTAAGMTGSPKAIPVAVLANDSVDDIAGKIRTELDGDSDVTALFTVGGTGATVTLTSKTYAANDATLNIATADDTCVGLTTAGTSANTAAGVVEDTVSVGIANKFGIPHIVDNASLLQEAIFDGSDDAGGSLAVDDDEVEKNLYTIAGTPDGSKVLTLIYLA